MRNRSAFEVEKKPIHYMNAPGNSSSDPRLKQMRHTLVNEIAVPL